MENRTASHKSFPCVVCSKRTKTNDRRELKGVNNRYIRRQLYKTLFISVQDTDVICGKCRVIFYRKCSKESTNNPTTVPIEDNVSIDTVYEPLPKKSKCIKSPKSISLPLSSLPGASHSTCCFCKKRDFKLIVVPSETRYNIFIDHNVIIPAGARCCPGHFFNDKLKDDICVKSIVYSLESTFSRTELLEVIQNVREIAIKTKATRIHFDEQLQMSDSDYVNLIGINKDSFNDLCSKIQDIRQSKTRSQRTCVGILLTKLRTGMSNRLLSTIFNVGIDSIKRAISSARKVLSRDFTNHHVGFSHIDRETVISQHTRGLAQTLFGGYNTPAILVLDGTYIYIQKSSDFKFQRRSYSLHKKRPLVKPMMIVTTTGYVVSVLGPYFSDYSNNDANIVKHAFAHNIEHLKQWIREDDVFIVDRGFRDAVDVMHELGIQTEMPAFLKKGQKQHTTADSNTSWLITKIRWVVESVNGRLKNWKLLDGVVSNSQIPYIGEYVKLVCAITNKYCNPLCLTKDDDESIGLKMLYLSKQSNHLMEMVESEGLDRQRSCWKSFADTCTTENINFPVIDEEYLRNKTLGIYQIKLAKSYTNEHINDDGNYELLFNVAKPGILMAKIQSRHSSGKSHKLWIEYTEILVTGWYCKCRAGARVVGACAHVSAVIWYLGYARYHSDVTSEWTMYLQDAKDLPEPLAIDEESDVEE